LFNCAFFLIYRVSLSHHPSSSARTNHALSLLRGRAASYSRHRHPPTFRA